MSITSYLDNDGNKFYCVYINLSNKLPPYNRKQKRVKSITSLAHAKRIEKKERQKILNEFQNNAGQGGTWQQVVFKYFTKCDDNDCYQSVSKGTSIEYRHIIRTYTKGWYGIKLSNINREHIRYLVEELDQKKLSIAYKKKVIYTIKSIYNWGFKEGFAKDIGNSPFLNLKIISERPSSSPDILSTDEIKQFLSLSKKQNHSWSSIWHIAIWTGLRCGELYALEWRDINFTVSQALFTQYIAC